MENKHKKLNILHFIETNKSMYRIYNIEPLKESLVSICIERDGISILEKEILDESWGLMGGDSFSRFVSSCINRLRSEIKHSEEVIIKDEIMV